MFSVVIPLYNKELSITATVESVLKQDYTEFEVLIINDGSTDSSLIKVEALQDSRIRVLNQENQGVSAARNLGILNAKYEWIALLDGDDLWKKNHLSEIVKMMSVYPDSKVYATSFEYSDKRLLFKYKRETSIFKVDRYFNDSIRERILWTSIIVLNKKCFSTVGYFNVKLSRGEDLDLWDRVASHYMIVKSSEVTATYRVDSENRATGKIYPVDKSILSVINLKGIKGDKRRYYKYILLSRMKQLLLEGQYRCFLVLALKHHFRLLI